MKIDKKTPIGKGKIYGAGRVGYLRTTRKKIETILGYPNIHDDDYRVIHEWAFKCEGKLIRIYKWRDRNGNIDRRWHVGGHSSKVLPIVQKLFPTSTVEDND